MSDLLTAIQLACIVLLAIGAPAYAVVRIKWRAEAAEYALRNERLKSSRLEREIEQLRQALAEAQRHHTCTEARPSGSASQASEVHEADAQRPSE
jgi:hypothetical protein